MTFNCIFETEQMAELNTDVRVDPTEQERSAAALHGYEDSIWGLDIDEGADMTVTTTAHGLVENGEGKLENPVNLDKFMGQKERRHSSVSKVTQFCKFETLCP